MTNQNKADIILEGASFYCGKSLDNDVDFVAVKDNKIIATGQKDNMDQYIGHKTIIKNYTKNNLIMPGLHDNHIHLVIAGMLDKYVSLDGCKSQRDVALKTVEFAQTIPDEKWVIGFGFSRLEWEDSSLPLKSTLDELIPHRPVLLMDNELHSAWANSKAFEIAGINKDTPDPEFGEIDRLPDGEPKGFLYETALTLVAKYAFDMEEAVVIDLIKRYMKVANSYGITSASDMTPYLGIDLSYFPVFKKLAVDGELTMRINAARDLFEDSAILPEMKREIQDLQTDMYKVLYYKQFVDGVPGNYTALMIDDYSDKPGEKGGSLLPLDKLNAAVKSANENNIPVRLHACGDGAVRLALHAFEKAASSTATPIRNQIEHIEVTTKEDIPRFGQLGVIASIQPEHIVSGIDSHNDNCYPEILGPEREKYTWPFKSILDSGGILACGSDMPVVPGIPFEGLYVGLTRLHNDGTPEGGWNPHEKLSIYELLDGYTSGASYAEGKEDILGTLEEGKLADISVFDTNFLEADPEDIRAAGALLTMVDGKIVYEK